MAKATNWQSDRGDSSPADDAVTLRRTYIAGAWRTNTNTTTVAAGLIGWFCTVGGHPGTWIPIYASAGGSGALPRVATIAALAAIDCSAYSSSQAHLAEVLSVGVMFLHHPTGGLGTWSAATAYAVGDIVFRTSKSYRCIQAHTNQDPVTQTAYWTIDMTRVASTAGTHLWERIGVENRTMQAQTQWAIDPSNTSGLANDENLGYGTTSSAAQLVPLATMAEFRRRMKGAQVSGVVTMTVMSSSSNGDDAHLHGFTTTRSGRVDLIGVTTVIFSGTVTAYTALSGNDRQTVTDSAIPTSWTASGGISTTSRSRWIRKTTGNVHAPVLVDRGSKTAHIGLTTNATETGTAASALVAFSVSDAYEVYGVPSWPGLMTAGQQIAARTICLDITTFTWHSELSSVAILCGFLSTTAFRGAVYQLSACALLGASNNAEGGMRGGYNSYLNTTVQWSSLVYNGNNQHNLFVNAPFQGWHHCHLGAGGMFYCYDNTSWCVSMRHGSMGERIGIVGTGNTGLLLDAGDRSVVRLDTTALGGLAASTSSTTPVQVEDVQYPVEAIPIVNVSEGSAVYQ